jgi:Cupin-like domain
MKTTDIPKAASSVFVADEPGLRTLQEKFETEPFLFRHHLADDPRFAMDRIRNLAHRLPRKIGFSGDLPVEKGFRQPDASKMSFDETLDQLEAGHCWIILKKVQDDPEYGPLLPQCLDEVERHLGRQLEPLIESRTMSLILSSPGQVTPYHIDADCNFLFQIRGCKTFYAFNGRDRTVLPQEEEESFWAGNINAAKYREENQAKAWSFAMEPGNGVHVPVIFPHWVKNGDNLSVSLSINFRFLGRLRGDVCRMNHLLRKAGLHPRAAGQSKMVDLLKVAILSPPRAGITMMRKVLRRGK